MSDFDNNPYAADRFTGKDDYNFHVPAPNVPDYLIASILITIFCCPALGVVAIVFSAMASSEKSNGNYQRALAHAKNAKIFLLITVIGYALLIAIYVAIAIIIAVTGNLQ